MMLKTYHWTQYAASAITLVGGANVEPASDF
jgi:hypothetical protein